MNRLKDSAIDKFKRLQLQISNSASVCGKMSKPNYDELEPYAHLVKTFSSQAQIFKVLLRISEEEMALIPPDIGTDPWKAKSELQILKVWADSIELSLIRESQENTVKGEFLIPDGKSLTANNLITQILSRAEKTIKIVDNYLSEDSAVIIEGGTNSSVNIQILTSDNNPKKLKNFLDKVRIIKRGWQGSFEIKKTRVFHDRYIIVDDLEVWFSGPSIDSLGLKRPGVVCQLTDIKHDIVQRFDSEWVKAGSL